MLGVNIPDKGRCLPDYESVYGSRFHAAQRDGQTVVPRLRGRHAHYRLSLPFKPAGDLREPQYTNLTEVWLYGDHYKWRAMRANGVEEKYITGGEGVSDYDRFLA